MTEVVQAVTPEQIDATRSLVRAFVRWHRNRHQEDLHLIDAYFDEAAFEDELANLPGKYAPPDGSLLLATYEGQAAGCVALRALEGRTCEMKRMFVYDRFRGKGIGRALVEGVLRDARAAGYDLMRLDTSHRQVEALTLYARYGFVRIEPYYELPDDLRQWLVFMELAL
jgi:GNAT superfamily N-acetyltransferase